MRHSNPFGWRAAAAALALAGALLASGCATVAPPGGPAAAVSRGDPWEGFNRKVFAFNEAVDEALFKPLAEAYRAAVPSLVRRGVSNFFGNVGDAWSASNHLLQGKLDPGLEMGLRFAFNSVFGIAGVIDIAGDLGLARRSEDFGQTLAVWGLPSGPYLVMPLLGPSTLRDTAALPLDRFYASTGRYFSDYNIYAVGSLQLVNLRAELLDAGKLASEVSLDKYIFFRDAFFSRRLDQIYDGAAPLEDLDPGDDKKPAAAPKK
jgi:phospholipid-binding lipoprotein MlaA